MCASNRCYRRRSKNTVKIVDDDMPGALFKIPSFKRSSFVFVVAVVVVVVVLVVVVVVVGSVVVVVFTLTSHNQVRGHRTGSI